MIEVPVRHELVPGFDEIGVTAFTTTRAAGSFNLLGAEPAVDVFGRWIRLVEGLLPVAPRFAVAHQVHGSRVLRHDASWSGWLRDVAGADGHFTQAAGTALAVSLADCVPVFLAHPAGACAVLHSGWKGTETRIVAEGVAMFAAAGLEVSEIRLHLGPAICGRCYVVGPEVFSRLTGRSASVPTTVDLRALIAGHARALGVRQISIDPACTRCDNARFFSHRAGDAGRQLGVIVRG